jgi:uncharacterized membrane protein
MRFQHSIEINAPAGVAWSVMSDIPRWPEWTDTVISIHPEDAGPLRVGAKTKIVLRGAPKADWVVTEVRPGESFVWQSQMPGLTSIASHRLEPRSNGCSATLTIEFRGPAALFMRPFLKRTSVRNIAIEAAGLKRRSEELAKAAA